MDGYSGYWGGERLITDIAFARPKRMFLNISVSFGVQSGFDGWKLNLINISFQATCVLPY